MDNNPPLAQKLELVGLVAIIYPTKQTLAPTPPDPGSLPPNQPYFEAVVQPLVVHFCHNRWYETLVSRHGTMFQQLTKLANLLYKELDLEILAKLPQGRYGSLTLW